MKVVPLGDRAYLLTELVGEPWRLAHALNAAPPTGLVEAVAAYDAVAVHIDPATFDLASLFEATDTDPGPRRLHRIPVCYEMGLDLPEAALKLGREPAELVRWHSQTTYTCAAVGFRPGFAYLGKLPDAIAGLPRLASPRLKIPAGSVGITGTQTGVYPMESPGGWWIIGQTPLCMADPDSGYYPIEAGDEVVFVPIEPAEFHARKGQRL